MWHGIVLAGLDSSGHFGATEPLYRGPSPIDWSLELQDHVRFASPAVGKPKNLDSRVLDVHDNQRIVKLVTLHKFQILTQEVLQHKMQ